MRNDGDTVNALSPDGLGFALNRALSGTPFQFPQAVCYQDGSSPFRIDATLGEWQIPEGGSGDRIDITIASGTLRDIDKGTFFLAGMVLAMLVAGEVAPVAVVNPGPLSELQQEGLLDAISTYLNAPAIHYAIATVSFASQVPATIPGLLVFEKNSANAVLLISGDLFVSRAVLSGLASGVKGALGDFSLLSCAMRIAADRLVTTAQLGRTSSEGIEQTFAVRCSHSAHFDAASRTLFFVDETNPSEPPVDAAVKALAKAVAAAATKSIARVEFSRYPESSVALPVTGTFHIKTAVLTGAVCLQGNWS